MTAQDVKAKAIAKWTSERESLMKAMEKLEAELAPHREAEQRAMEILGPARAAIKAANSQKAEIAQQIAMLTRAIGPTHTLKAEEGKYTSEELAAK